MKKFRKIIPIVVIVLAITGAFTTHAMTRSLKTVNIQGYINTNPQGTICVASILCSDDFGPLCTIGSTQVFGKAANGYCIIQLYRNR